MLSLRYYGWPSVRRSRRTTGLQEEQRLQPECTHRLKCDVSVLVVGLKKKSLKGNKRESLNASVKMTQNVGNNGQKKHCSNEVEAAKM